MIEILTIDELSEILKVSPRTIRRRIKEGLPHLRFADRGNLYFEKNKALKWWIRHGERYAEYKLRENL